MATGETPTVAFDDDFARLLMHCTGCLRCQEACLHNNHIPRALYEVRALARAEGFDLGYEADRRAPLEVDGPELGFAESSTTAFFPDHELAHDLDALRQMAAVLAQCGLEVALVPLHIQWNGNDLLTAGMDGLYRDRSTNLAAVLAGFDRVITSSAALIEAAKTPLWREPFAALDGAILHWTEVAATSFPPAARDRAVYYHDACKLVRGAGVADAPRALIERVTGKAPLELAEHGRWALCCGAEAGLRAVAPETSADMRAAVIAELLPESVIVTASPRCLSHLTGGRNDVEVISLAELVLNSLESPHGE